MPGIPTTAIVVTYRTGPRLKDCLHVMAGDPDIDAVRVVNNGNPPDMLAWLRAFAVRHPHVDLIEAGGNIGFGAGNNLGVAGARDGYLLLINPDAVLKRGSVRAMIEAARNCASPWIVGGRIFDEYGREGRGPRRRELTLFRALTTFAGWNTWTLENTPAPDHPVPMEVVSGALMLMDTAGYRALGGFDERYFLHVEDVDLCRRARLAGGDVFYVPAAGVLHYGATSEAPSRIVAAHKADSLSLYFQKFASGPLDRLLAKLVSPLIRLAIMAKAWRQG